jgi:hypothetical protein
MDILGKAQTMTRLNDWAVRAAWLAAGLLVCARPAECAKPRNSAITLAIAEQRDAPVLKQGDPGTEDNKYGFEGGCVLKLGGAYHLFTSEMIGDPRWVKMRLAHWVSRDRLAWTRRPTMYESSGVRDGSDPRASFWAPMPVFNEREKRWNLFYVAYRAPVGPDGWHGRLWRAVSQVAGREGIDGPWQDAGIILEPGPASESWEGRQGTDSIFPFQAGRRWLGFYGSSNEVDYWKVGLIGAPKLAGPWKRLSQVNPVALSGDLGTENPVVTRLRNGRYVAVFDTIKVSDVIGYSESADGVHWSPAKQLRLQPSPSIWVKDVRTPLGLVEEDDGTFTLFYTGYEKTSSGKQGYGCLGLLRVRMEVE